MFKEFMKILMDKKTMVDEMGEEFQQMLKTSKTMFIAATDLLYLGGDEKKVHKDIFPADKMLNKLECEIRQEVVTHISVAGADNLASMLVFMSVVKDAERVGDYIKNIYDIAVNVKDFAAGKYGELTLDLRNQIVLKFNEVAEVFSDSDTSKAKNLLTEIRKLQKKCDEIIMTLVREPGTERSVAYALMARYYKRILAHLSNIATAVVMPVNKLDFFDEEKR